MLLGKTQRLTIRTLTEQDDEFVLSLLNDEAFLKNIGDKKVRNSEDAIQYLVNGPMASYKEHGFGLNLVCLQNCNTPIGMCGLLKRPDFQYADLGYAFLPQYCQQGFAYEASKLVLNDAFKRHHLAQIYAVTLPNNIGSNQLLKKLGFAFSEQIEFSGTLNNLYKVYLPTRLAS